MSSMNESIEADRTAVKDQHQQAQHSTLHTPKRMFAMPSAFTCVSIGSSHSRTTSLPHRGRSEHYQFTHRQLCREP